jgi:hypothetical protein
MKKRFGFILLMIIFFNNLANATPWPLNTIKYYEKYYEKNLETFIYCQERGYQTSNSFNNCLKNLNYFSYNKIPNIYSTSKY